MKGPIVVTPALTIPEHEFGWRAVRSSGPGGQNVNKVASKIELRFDVKASRTLDPVTKARLSTIAGWRIGGDGVLRITSMLTRDRERNLSDAREKLAALIRRALERPKKRTATRPTRGSKERRLEAKRHRTRVMRERVDQD